MLNKTFISIFLVFLIITSVIPVSAQLYRDPYSRISSYGFGEESLGVWGVDIEQQSPLVVPAVALEHRSRAPVLLKVRFYPLTLIGGEDLEITSVYVSQVKTQRGVGNVRYKDLDEDPDEDGILTKTERTGIVYVLLDRVGTGRDRTPKFSERDVEKACQEITGKGIVDVVPDELNISLRAVIRFTAQRPDGTYLDRRDFASGSVGWTEFDIEHEAQEKIDYENNRRVNLDPPQPFLTTDQENKIREDVRRKYESRVQRTITDVVYFDTVIPIDKSRVYNPSPEKLRGRICDTIKLREKMAKIIKTVEKVETVATVGCLSSLIGSTIGVLLGMNYCDAVDTISLGCDWVFCPRDKCTGNVDPFNSIVASSYLCWDSNRQFFGKTLTSNIIRTEKVEGKDVEVFSGTCGYSECPEEDPECPEGNAGLTIPHYGCVSGVRSNLEIIDLMIKKYQDCLVAAKTGGISVGVCDRLKNAFICDRAVGVVLDLFKSKTSGDYFRNLFEEVAKSEKGNIEGSAEDAKKSFKDRINTLTAVSRNTVEEYDKVPFFKMFSEKEKYLQGRICATLIDGGFFNIKDLKNNLLRVPIPDSYFVLTEKRVWGDIGEKTEGEEFGEKSYSYDVFYQIYSGEGYYQRGGNYNIYLKGFRDTNKACRIPIASGFVPAGEMIQENVYRVDVCSAEEQCIVFKNRENCNNIDQLGGFAALTPGGVSADPFGLSLLFMDDIDNDGMSDSCENEYGLADPYGDEDDDGFCNAVECDKGSDPTDEKDAPDSSLKGISECRDLVETKIKANEKGLDESKEKWDTSRSSDTGEESETTTPSLSVSSIKIKRDTTLIDDYSDNILKIENGGIYDLEFTFDKDIKGCEVNEENFEHSSSIDLGAKTCKINDVELIGEERYTFSIKADAEDTKYRSFEKVYEITNNEPKVESKVLLCELNHENLGENFGLCLYPERDVNKRCSDYKVMNTNYYGDYIDDYNTRTECMSDCDIREYDSCLYSNSVGVEES